MPRLHNRLPLNGSCRIRINYALASQVKAQADILRCVDRRLSSELKPIIALVYNMIYPGRVDGLSLSLPRQHNGMIE